MTASIPNIPLLIGGKFVQSDTTQWRDVVNPATQQVLARVPLATADELAQAVAAAKAALAAATAWASSSAVANGTRARTSCVAGLTTSRHCVVLDWTNLPPISSGMVGILAVMNVSCECCVELFRCSFTKTISTNYTNKFKIFL